MELFHPFGGRTACEGTYGWLNERAIEREIGLGYARRGCEAAIIRGVVCTHSADVFQRPGLASHRPVARYEIAARAIRGFAFKHRLVETRRKRIDEVDVAGEFVMFLTSHAGGNKYSQVTDAFVDRVDDCLSERADLVDILIQIENPTECLRGRRDVVTLGAENDDGRPNVAQVDGHAISGLYSARREFVPYEQLIDNELDFFSIQVDVATPPALET